MIQIAYRLYTSLRPRITQLKQLLWPSSISDGSAFSMSEKFDEFVVSRLSILVHLEASNGSYVE